MKLSKRSVISAIVLAAGRGERFSKSVSKMLAAIGDKPVLAYSLLAFNQHPLVGEIILVVNSANKNSILKAIRKYRLEKLKKIILGGPRRQDSVNNALKHLGGASGFVLVHDGARPFVRQETISLLISRARKTGAAIVGVPVKETIKEINDANTVRKTLQRDKLWQVQTPQVFKKKLLLEAYRRFVSKRCFTDDAAVLEKMGCRVSVVSGKEDNIKITTPLDLALAKIIDKNGT